MRVITQTSKQTNIYKYQNLVQTRHKWIYIKKRCVHDNSKHKQPQKQHNQAIRHKNKKKKGKGEVKKENKKGRLIIH